ncbi:penicillin-binding protein activator [Sphingomonas quercus]|uniref:Penicillin-binding protein activator n=1 Tax=Sphingomonas quercus TaxID=2842451 RepID=A0ABS6BGU6_9SPHN|nr:penicillin-binding protein activator [Sphingomonas quercus]MBU3076465.1 penicillin-binding protein activator [Sphingomonas quercus]
MAERPPVRQPRRSFLRAAGLALTLAVAACVAPRERPAPPPAAPPPPVQTAPVGPLPTDVERHRVALLVPMTGSNAGVGQSIANAANLALLDANDKSLRITTYDTAGAGGAAAAARRALAEGNQLFLGPLLGEDVRVATPVAVAAHVPLIAFSNDSSAAASGVYLLGFTPGGAIDRVVDYAASRGLRRFAGLMPKGVYGRRASNAFLRAVEDAKGNVVAMADYDRTPASLNAAVAKLQAAGGYDALLIADSGRIVLQAVPLARRGGGAQARILGTELWNTDPALSRDPVMAGSWFASVSDGLYNQFAAKYRARFGRGPYRLSSLGYDSVLLTMRIAANWKVGAPFPQAALRDADGFAGVDGAFRFGGNGIAERALEVKQIGPGGLTTISPAPRSFTGN